ARLCDGGSEVVPMVNQITFKVTLNLDANWASHASREQLVEYIRDRLNSSLGFRGQVEHFSVVGDEPNSGLIKSFSISRT
ncbi:MAG: hypothetical protein JSW38_07050, partial [Dehalococcoidia bacterium]